MSVKTCTITFIFDDPEEAFEDLEPEENFPEFVMSYLANEFDAHHIPCVLVDATDRSSHE